MKKLNVITASSAWHPHIVTAAPSPVTQFLKNAKKAVDKLSQKEFDNLCQRYLDWFDLSGYTEEDEDPHGDNIMKLKGRPARTKLIMSMEPIMAEGGLADFLSTHKVIKASIKAAAWSVETAGWFESLSKEKQKEYIKTHPNSKYAKGAGKSKAPAKKKRRYTDEDAYRDAIKKANGIERKAKQNNDRAKELMKKPVKKAPAEKAPANTELTRLRKELKHVNELLKGITGKPKAWHDLSRSKTRLLNEIKEEKSPAPKTRKSKMKRNWKKSFG